MTWPLMRHTSPAPEGRDDLPGAGTHSVGSRAIALALQLPAFSKGDVRNMGLRLLPALVPCVSMPYPMARASSRVALVKLSVGSLLVTVMHISFVFLFSGEYGPGREAFRCDSQHLQSWPVEYGFSSER